MITLQKRIFHWLNSINSDSTSREEPRSSPHVRDDDLEALQLEGLGGSISPRGPTTSSDLGMSGLSLRGGADHLHRHSERRQDRRLGFLKHWRIVLSDQLLEGAPATRPIRIPGQVRYGPRFLEDGLRPTDEAYPTRVFTNLPDPKADRRAAIQSWLYTAILEKIDQRHTQSAFSFENNGEPSAIVLPLTSVANNAVDFALASAQDSPFAIGVNETDQGSQIAQEEPVPVAASDRDSGYEM